MQNQTSRCRWSNILSNFLSSLTFSSVTVTDFLFAIFNFPLNWFLMYLMMIKSRCDWRWIGNRCFISNIDLCVWMTCKWILRKLFQVIKVLMMLLLWLSIALVLITQHQLVVASLLLVFYGDFKLQRWNSPTSILGAKWKKLTRA